MKKSFKVLIVEKDEITTAIIDGYLKEVDGEFSIEKTTNLADAEKLIDENSVNLFIVDISENEEEIIFQINDIEKKYRNCKFIITSYNLKTDYIVRFLRTSKKDFINKPIAKTAFLKTFTEIYEKMTSEQDFSGHGKIITIYSNKGGLGKTTIAVNLAWQLGFENPSSKIAIVDMNMFLGDVTTFLDTNPPYDMNFIIDKIDSDEDISNLAAAYDESNLYIIADSPYREYSNIISKEAIIKLFNALRKKFKYIVVDCSSAITGKSKNVFYISDLILLITEANLPTLNNCKRCLDFFERINVREKTELVLNRFSYDDDCSPEDIESVLKKNIFTGIPNDWQTVTESINRGVTIGECHPETTIYDSYKELAELVEKKLCR